MHLMEPNMKMGRDVWDRVNMPPEEFDRRAAHLTTAMADLGVGALVLYGGVGNHYGDPAYLCNFLLRMSRGAVAILTQSGELTLVYEGIDRAIHMAKAVSHVEDVRSGRDMAVETLKVLTEKKVIPGKIGFSGIQAWMPHHQARHLTETLGKANMVDAEPLMRQLRLIKSIREQDQIRRSGRIVGQALQALAGLPAAGATGRTVDARLKRAARMEGAEDIRVVLGAAKTAGWSLSPPDDTPLAEGDTLIVLLAVEFERYWGQAMRTFHVRDGALRAAEPGILEKPWQGLLDALKPGRLASDIHREILDTLKSAGLEWEGEYGLGEGLGLGPFEPPEIVEGDTTELREGMCLAIRLMVKDPTLGTIAIGETVLITGTGAELLGV